MLVCRIYLDVNARRDREVLSIGIARSARRSASVQCRLVSHLPVTIGAMTTMTRDLMAVIGPCKVGNCGRAATQHVTITAPPPVVAGAVCDRCAAVTDFAAFLLDLQPKAA